MVPEVDRHIGIEVYSTPSPSIDASIRSSKASFIVDEVIDLDALSITSIMDKNRYALFKLRKSGIDSIHALREVRVKYGIRLKILGLKDAYASTTQFALASIRDIKVMDHILATEHCMLELVGYTDRMMSKKHLLGNSFNIRVYSNESTHKIIDAVNMIRDYAKDRRVANFYGYQRFGSSRAVTHLIGKAIVKRLFNDALNILLTYTTDYESREQRRIRLELRDKGLSKELVDSIPNTMDIERIAAREMLKSNDPIRALRALPIEVRRLFVEAYQAYIFNKVLSIAVSKGYDISRPLHDDVCFTLKGNRLDSIKVGGDVVALPLVGYAFKPKGRFGELSEQVMKEEGIKSKEFYVKEMQEVSVEGGFRPAPLLLMDDISYDNASIRFALHKGCYATILLREIIKPKDPIRQGF